MKNALEESSRIMTGARERGVVLRLIGGLAVRHHCTEYEFCERDYGDIDFVGLSQQSSTIIEVIKEFGYHENRHYTLASGGTRLLFERPDSNDHVDVFLDRLPMEHNIDLRGRLNIEENTISVSDILVSKLIIAKMNEKDYRDIITIVKDLALGEEDTPKTINIKYLATLCAKNWGLYYDIITTLDACADFMKQYDLDEQAALDVREKLMLMRDAVVTHPKSVRWKLRGRIGKRLAWRREVELENKV